MGNIDQIKFQLRLGDLKSFVDFDKAFSDQIFTVAFAEFIQSPIGKVWMQKEKSHLFRNWQRE